MRIYACKEHVEEAMDFGINETGAAPEIESSHTGVCFLCGEKSAYQIDVPEKKSRCKWCRSEFLYEQYHDLEWGVPCHSDQKQFEFLVLESAQAGLSWITILKKRENYKEAYDQFCVEQVAAYGQEKIEQLLENKGIIRNRKKIEASIQNARCFLEIQKEFGSFSSYIWSFVGGKPIVNHWQKEEDVPAQTEESRCLSKDMKKRGFQFLGPVILYSHMQAMGLVNDHVVDCFRHKEVSEKWEKEL